MVPSKLFVSNSKNLIDDKFPISVEMFPFNALLSIANTRRFVKGANPRWNWPDHSGVVSAIQALANEVMDSNKDGKDLPNLLETG